MKKLTCALLALTLCLTMAACGKKTEMDDGTVKEGLCYEATGYSPDAVAMTVEGTEVPMDIYYYFCNQATIYMEQMMSYYGLSFDWDAEFTQTMTTKDIVREEACFSAAQLVTVENLAAKYNAVLSEEMAAAMEEERLAAIEEVGGEEVYAQLVERMGLRAESYERIRRSQYLQAALQEMYLTEGSELYAEEATLVAFAEENGYMTADHILLGFKNPYTNEAFSEEEIEKRRVLADELLARLKAYEGDDLEGYFTELAYEYTEDPGHIMNPSGYTFGPGEMVVEFESGAAALQPGEFSEVIESEFGLHIIMRKELNAAPILETMRASYFTKLVYDATEKAAIVKREGLDAIDLVAGYEAFLAYQGIVTENGSETGEEAPAAESESPAEGEETPAG